MSGRLPDLLALRADLEAVLATPVVEMLEAFITETVRAELADAGQVNEASSPWLTLDEAATYLRISERTLARRIAKKRIRSTSIGRRRLLHRDDLDALARAAAGEETAPTAPPRRRKGVE